MAPKVPRSSASKVVTPSAAAPKAVEPIASDAGTRQSTDSIKRQSTGGEADCEKTLDPVWSFGVNDCLKGLDSLPSDFQATNTIKGDYLQVMKAIGGIPHPGFKYKKIKPPRRVSMSNPFLPPMSPMADKDKENMEEMKKDESPFFTIHGMRLDLPSVVVMSLILPEARTVKAIRLINCCLDLAMLRLLRKGLVGNCSVECLQVDWNQFDVDGGVAIGGDVSDAADTGPEEENVVGVALAELADGECVLECLSLRSCRIGLPEVLPLAAAIGRCPWQLKQLNLWENEICDDGAKALAVALADYRGLEFLGLGRNRITDIGLTSLCEAFSVELLTQAGDVQAAKEKIIKQKDILDADTKARAKAKAKPRDPNAKPREPVLFVDKLEDPFGAVFDGVPPAPAGKGKKAEEPPPNPDAVFVLRKYCELKSMSMAENPIMNVATLETLQPLGPSCAELAVLGTPVAAALLLRFPDLSARDKKAFCFATSAHVDIPQLGQSDGWLLRLV